MPYRTSPFGDIVAKARRLNADAKNLALSKNSRNACVTAIRALERETGLDLYRA